MTTLQLTSCQSNAPVWHRMSRKHCSSGADGMRCAPDASCPSNHRSHSPAAAHSAHRESRLGACTMQLSWRLNYWLKPKNKDKMTYPFEQRRPWWRQPDDRTCHRNRSISPHPTVSTMLPFFRSLSPSLFSLMLVFFGWIRATDVWNDDDWLGLWELREKGKSDSNSQVELA